MGTELHVYLGQTFACVHQSTMSTFRTPDFKIMNTAGEEEFLLKGPVHPYPSMVKNHLFEVRYKRFANQAFFSLKWKKQ